MHSINGNMAEAAKMTIDQAQVWVSILTAAEKEDAAGWLMANFSDIPQQAFDKMSKIGVTAAIIVGFLEKWTTVLGAAQGGVAAAGGHDQG